MKKMSYVNTRFHVAKFMFAIFLFYIISLDKCLRLCQEIVYEKSEKLYFDEEDVDEVLYGNPSIYMRPPKVPETLSSILNINDIPENTEGNLFKDEFCKQEDPSALAKIKDFIKQTFCSTQDRCRLSQLYKQMTDNIVSILKSSAEVGKTSMCLIDTGANINAKIMKGYYKNKSVYGINTTKCTEEKQRNCETYDFSDVSENVHGTFITDVISNGEILKGVQKKLRNSYIICKAFGEKKKPHVFPLIKCLEHCKRLQTKVIHVSFNVKSYDKRLHEVLEELHRDGVFIIVPSYDIYDAEEPEYIKSDSSEAGLTTSIHLEESYISKNIRQIVFPAVFSNAYNNIFSVGSLEFSNLYEKQIDSKKILFKEKLNTLFTNFFSFILPFLYDSKYNPSLYYSPAYASATFAHILSVTLNLNPQLTVNSFIEILNRSIIKHPELSSLSRLGGYIHVLRLLHYSLKSRGPF